MKKKELMNRLSAISMAVMMTVTMIPSNAYAADELFSDVDVETTSDAGNEDSADAEVSDADDTSDADIEVEEAEDDSADVNVEADEEEDSEEVDVFSDDLDSVGDTLSDAQSDIVANGSCGTKATWELTKDGVLTVSGTGTMRNYGSSAKTPWYQYVDNIKSVKVEKGITKIGKYDFSDCVLLEKVELPEGLTDVGQASFKGCTNLKNINLPDSLSVINYNAFENCTSLEEINISKKITVGGSAFKGCTGLKKAVIDCRTVASEMFEGCVELDDVEIGENVISLGSQAFSETGLKTITIPETITRVADSVFAKCPKLEEATINNENIDSYLFLNCTSLKKINIGSKLTSISLDIFSGCTSLEELNLDTENKNLNIVDSVIYSADGKVLQKCVPGKAGALTIPDGVEEIGENALADCGKITKIVFPGSLKTINSSAFKNCSGLQEIMLPEGLETLGNDAFKNCTGLEKITIPSTVTNLSAQVFTGCTSLHDIVFTGEGGNYKAEDGIVYTTDGKIIFCLKGISGEITVPEGVTELSNYAFSGCKDITKINLPSTLTSIGVNAFGGCSSLEAIVIPDSVIQIGTGAFSSCEELQDIKLPVGLTELSASIFYGCSSLKKIELPDTITSVGASAFEDCSSLKAITLPAGVSSFQGGIGFNDQGNTFYGCTSLKKIVIPEGVTEIPSQAFRECNSLKEIVLPSTITAVGYNTISNADVVIHFGGSGKQWKAIRNIKTLSFASPDYYYGASEDDSIIVTQPEKANYKKGEDVSSTPLKMIVKATEDGSTYEFVWYRDSKKNEGAVNCEVVEKNVEVSEDGTSSTCIPDTSEASHYYYFCVAAKKNSDSGLVIARSQNAEIAVALENFAGSGTEENPYQISSVDDLQTLYNMVAEGNTMKGLYFQMMEDITLPEDWKSIGILPEDKENPNMAGQDRGTGANIKPFSGIFDGNGKTLTVAKGGQPLFGYVRSATVKDLNIQGEYIATDGLVAHYVVDYGPDGNYNTGNDGGSYAEGCPDTIDIINVTIKSGTTINGSGFLGGYASGANTVNIRNCTVESGVKIGWNAEQNASSGRNYVGSLAGEFNGTVLGCTSAATVYGNDGIGGLIGAKGQSMGPYEIRNSSFSGSVSATGEYAGGISGQGYNSSSAPNTPGVTIENCYAIGSVSGVDCVGGIIGGEPAQAQAWNVSYICNNHFAGTVSGTGAKIGGIIGYLRSINKCNIIENNYYLDTCGAVRGIGNILYVDTSAKSHGWTEDNASYYMNTSIDDLSIIKNETDPTNQYTSISKAGYNRADDPLGKDADKLSKAMSATQFTDNTVTNLLNASESSMHNWEQGENYPKFGQGAVAYKMTVSGEYKTEYYIGEELDLSGLKVTVYWSDGKQSQPELENLKVTGFNSSTRGIKTLTLAYGSAKAQIEITVLKKDSDNIKVYFELLGDQIHNSDDDKNVHTLHLGNLETWIENQEYEIDGNATVADLVAKVLKKNKYKYDNASGNYISAITKPDGTKLSEFTNGQNSGWEYTLNGIHPNLGVAEQYLEDGDIIVFHYTDDYKQEHDHIWSSKWTTDKNAHWHECTYEFSDCDITDNTKKAGYGIHTFDEGKVTKAATCKEAGEKVYTCTVCGATKKEVLPKTTDHKYTWKVVSKATVFAPEKQQGTCSVCGTVVNRDNGKKLTATIKLNATSIKLQKKQTTKKIRVAMANGDSVRSWTSSNKKIVTVDKKGVIKAGKKTGTAKITVTLKSGKKATLKVKVQTSKVKTTKISGLKKNVTLKKGQKLALKPVVSPLTSQEKVTYASSNKKVATVSKNGTITAKKKGTVKITVRSGKKSYVIKVKVK